MLNKLRSFLTTLGIIIGVAAVIIMLAVSAGAEAEIEDQISGLGANLIMVTPFRSFGGVRRGPGGGGPGNITTFTYDEVVFLSQNLRNVSGVSLEQSTSQNVKGGSATMTGVSIVGVTADFLKVRDYEVAQGRFFTAAENDATQRVAILGAGIAEDLFDAVDPIGQQVRIGSSRFTVIGVMADQASLARLITMAASTFRLGCFQKVRRLRLWRESRAHDSGQGRERRYVGQRDEPDYSLARRAPQCGSSQPGLRCANPAGHRRRPIFHHRCVP